MFEALRTPRRVILSGTPIQNELSEFHAMVGSSPAARENAIYTFVGRLLQPRITWSVASIRRSMHTNMNIL